MRVAAVTKNDLRAFCRSICEHQGEFRLERFVVERALRVRSERNLTSLFMHSQ